MQMTTWQQIVFISATMLLFFVTSVRSAAGKMTAPAANFATVRAAGAAPAPTSVGTKKAKMRMVASWYGEQFQGRKTSSGEIFDLNKLTAAHKTLPLGSLVRLTALKTGRSVVVKINDRGPWINGRDLDLSEAAAIALGIHNKGVAPVEMAVLR